MAHGAPTIAVEDSPYTRVLGDFGRQWRPRAIVLFSAHWENEVQTVSAVERYRTIYDFGGFAPELYQITYPARGDAELTEEICLLLSQEGISVQTDSSRGLDHGAWCLLHVVFPQAEIPVIAMSVDPTLPPPEQYRVGKALSTLRAKDIMVIGSGGTVHNFQTARWGAQTVDPWAVEFDDWVLARAQQWDLKSLFAYQALAPHARLAVPPYGNEHFVPLFYAMGAADDQRTVKELFRGYAFGNFSYSLWQFGE